MQTPNNQILSSCIKKIKIVISGSAETSVCSADACEKAYQVGKLIAKNGCLLLTGATTGIPLWAAKGAKSEGGMVIGFSPAYNLKEHLKVYQLPYQYHDYIFFTGLGYAGRNLQLVRAGDGVIFICGRMGTLNEFTNAFEEQKPMGVLLKTGGTEQLMDDIVNQAKRGEGKIIWEENLEILVKKLIDLITEDIKNQLETN